MQRNGKFDFIKYLFFLNKQKAITLVLDLSLLIITIIISTKGISDLSNWILVFFSFSILKLSYSTYKWLSRYKTIFKFSGYEIKDDFLNYSNLIPSEREEIKKFNNQKIQLGHTYDMVIFSKIINDALFHDSLEPQISISIRNSGYKRVQGFIKRHREVLEKFLFHQFYKSTRDGMLFINEKKLCINEDIGTIIKNKTLYCHKGTYFDTFLTNQVTGKYLVHKDSEDVIADARFFFPKEVNSQRLIDITKTKMNNEIGISTLVLTADNYFIIWRQSRKSQVSIGLLVPSGSGSCDYADLSEFLFQTVSNAMVREVMEEGKLQKYPDVKFKTIITGFYRWVDRGGKPEFVGISKTNLRLNDFRPNETEVLDTDDIYITSIDEITKTILDYEKKNFGKLSVPLFMCFQSLKLHLNNPQQKESLKQLLNL